MGRICKVLALAVLALSFVLPAAAQVDVVCTPSPVIWSHAIVDKKSAPNLQQWVCVVENLGLQAVEIQEAKVQGWLMRQGVAARSSRMVRIGVGEVQRKRWPNTVGRFFLEHAPQLGVAALAMGGVKVKEPWLKTAIGSSGLVFPILGNAAVNREVDPAVFEQTAMQGDATLVPGRSLEVSLFAAPLEQPPLSIRGELMPAQVTLRDIGTWQAPTTAELWAAAFERQQLAGWR